MRVRPQTWLADLMKAATKVFTAKGYRQAQMSDIAREMGVSQGTLYNYVESKEALFQLVCERGFNSAPHTPQRPPIASVSFEGMLQRIREQSSSNARLEALRAALRTGKPINAQVELEGMLRELYSAIERNRHGFDLVERSTGDVPELAEMLFEEGRRRSLRELAAHYAEAEVKGEIVLVIGPPGEAEAPAADALDAALREAMVTASVKDAASEVAARFGLRRREVYARALELKRQGVS